MDLSQTDLPHARNKVEIGGLLNVHEVTKEVAKRAIVESEKRPEQLDDLVERTKEARQALLEAIRGIGDSLETFNPASDEYLRSIRQFRMTAIAEIGGATRALADLRKFFIGAEHEKEVAALREFVELCERLERLKKSGFLDVVADTILRLA